jgi:hypothetical protein
MILAGQKKDVSDALAGVCYHLTHQVNAWQLVGKVQNAGFAAAIYASAADRALSYLARSLRPNPNGSQYMKFATAGKGSRTDHVR